MGYKNMLTKRNYFASRSIRNKNKPVEESFFSRVKRTLIADAGILILIPLLSTGISLAIAYGSFLYYGIPSNFIAFDTPTIVNNIFPISLPLLYLYLFLKIFLMQIRKGQITLNDLFISEFVFLFFIYILYFSAINNREFINQGVLGILLIVFILLSFLKSKMKKVIIIKKIENPKNSIPYENLVVLSISGLLLIFIFMSAFGFIHSMYKENYYVMEDNPKKVILTFYDDKAIIGYYDYSSKQLEDTFSIINIGEDSTLKFKEGKIGPFLNKTKKMTISVSDSLFPH